jgi:hypothetical protein
MTVLDPIVLASSVPTRSPAQPPPGTTVVEQRLLNGIPALFPLTRTFTLAVALPTGLAATWRDADPTSLVSGGNWERGAPPPAPGWSALGSPARPPLLLVLLDTTATGAAGRATRRPVAAIPAAAGVPRRLPLDGTSPVGITVTMLDWQLFAGTVLGAGDNGSWVRFAWRPVGPGSDSFDAPPVNQNVRARFGQRDLSIGVGQAAADPAGYAPRPAATTLREWV